MVRVRSFGFWLDSCMTVWDMWDMGMMGGKWCPRWGIGLGVDDRTLLYIILINGCDLRAVPRFGFGFLAGRINGN